MQNSVLKKLRDYAALIRLDKPIGTLLLLWPTLMALYLANEGQPSVSLLFIFVVGTFLMRSCGCAINDIADRHFDRHVQRTAQRPLTAGRISVREALSVAILLGLLAFLLILPLNIFAQGFAVFAFILTCIYPYTKRFFSLPQLHLGITFGCGIPMAYAAVEAHISLDAGLLWLATIFWILAYDTEYAMVDREDDKKIGIRTSAITFGHADVAIVMLCYCVYLSLMAYLGWHHQLGLFFVIAWCLAAACVCYHYTLIRKREPAKCFKAFLHNQWIGALLFLGIVLHYS